MLSELCVRCGLCCDGTLFTFLPLSADEAKRMQVLGASVKARKDGRWALRLGCSVLQGSCCGAYSERPQRCRDFVCELGRAVERGDRSIDGALAVIEETKGRVRELEALLPEAGDDVRGAVFRGATYEASEPDDPRFREVRARTRELEALLATYFTG